MIIALAGRRIDPPEAAEERFPLRNVPDVEAQLQQLIESLLPTGVVCSAACGADLVALNVARRFGARGRIVLPFTAAHFRDTSVTDRPGDWGRSFDLLYAEALKRGDVVLIEDSPQKSNNQASYVAVNRRIIEEALDLAVREGAAKAASQGVVAVIVWEGRSRGTDDLTAGFAAMARAAGIRVEEVNTLRI